MTDSESGAKLVCDALLGVGVECVFGLPGTQNVGLYEALRTSSLRTVVATSELSAAMMANGYYRASGRVAALATIPGPGFMWTLPGLAEASLDSTALLHIVGSPAKSPGNHYQLQAIDQQAIVRSLVRATHHVETADAVAGTIASAYADAVRSEPGPVVVHVDRSVLEARAAGAPVAEGHADRADDAPDTVRIGEIARMLRSAKRCVVFAGQGCTMASAPLLQVVERLGAPVVTSTSGRGVVPEDHPLSLGFEFGGDAVETLNELVAACDVVLAVGFKFSHNGSRGFRLRIPADKLIHVDASGEVLGANYPAHVSMRADAGVFLAELSQRLGDGSCKGFGNAGMEQLRARARAEALAAVIEPRIHGVASGSAAEFFASLRTAMPRDGVLVTDSGIHQSLARRHFRVLGPRALVTPTNLQSMGFCIGAAIGACVADPKRAVVALLGDGGLSMSGLELLVAVRERLRLVVVVFVDGAYGLIRFQQLASTGKPFATTFEPPHVAALAEAVGARYMRLEGDATGTLRTALESDGVTLVEVGVGDSLPMHWMRAKAVVRGQGGSKVRSSLRRLFGRR